MTHFPNATELFFDCDFEYWEDKAREAQKREQEWRDKQPEDIAVKMTNEEIVTAYKLSNTNQRVEFLFSQPLRIVVEDVKIINGKAFKRIKNPKTRGVEVIPWNS